MKQKLIDLVQKCKGLQQRNKELETKCEELASNQLDQQTVCPSIRLNLTFIYADLHYIIYVKDATSSVSQGPSQQELDKYKSLLDKAVPKMKEMQVFARLLFLN